MSKVFVGCQLIDHVKKLLARRLYWSVICKDLLIQSYAISFAILLYYFKIYKMKNVYKFILINKNHTCVILIYIYIYIYIYIERERGGRL